MSDKVKDSVEKGGFYTTASYDEMIGKDGALSKAYARYGKWLEARPRFWNSATHRRIFCFAAWELHSRYMANKRVWNV